MWFNEGAFLVPAIEIPANYTQNYVTLNESGEVILQVLHDDPIVIKNEKEWKKGRHIHSLFWYTLSRNH